jgi:hypothetical protein
MAPMRVLTLRRMGAMAWLQCCDFVGGHSPVDVGYGAPCLGATLAFSPPDATNHDTVFVSSLFAIQTWGDEWAPSFL